MSAAAEAQESITEAVNVIYDIRTDSPVPSNIQAHRFVTFVSTSHTSFLTELLFPPATQPVSAQQRPDPPPVP